MTAVIRLVGLVFVAVVMAAGCGTDAPAGDAQRPAPPADQNTQTPTELRFTATTVDGQEFSGESLAGKPAVLWFWAAWCPTCEREAPGVATVAEAHADTVTFVGVAALSDTPDMRDFVDRTGIGGFTNIADSESSVWQRFGVTAQPAYAFISPDGTVETVKGSLTEETLTDRVRQLVQS